MRMRQYCDQTEPRFSKSLQDAGEHGVCIKKRTDKRQIPYVGAGSLAVKKQRSEEWAKKKESASAQKSKEHAQKKGLVCDTADLLLLSQRIKLCDGRHHHHSGGRRKCGRKQEQGQCHSGKDPIDFQ